MKLEGADSRNLEFVTQTLLDVNMARYTNPAQGRVSHERNCSER